VSWWSQIGQSMHDLSVWRCVNYHVKGSDAYREVQKSFTLKAAHWQRHSPHRQFERYADGGSNVMLLVQHLDVVVLEKRRIRSAGSIVPGPT